MENEDIEYVVKPESPTSEEQLEHYMTSSRLIRFMFGKPSSSLTIQGIRGLFWSFIFIWVIVKLILLLGLAASYII